MVQCCRVWHSGQLTAACLEFREQRADGRAFFGAEAFVPLAITAVRGRSPVVGGLVLSQLLTLYITPVYYIYLDNFQKWLQKIFGKKKKDDAPSGTRDLERELALTTRSSQTT